MEYSECLPTLLTPLAERTCFPQARGDAAIVITGRSPEWCGRRLDGGAVLPKRLTPLGLVLVCGNPMRGSRAESTTVEHESAALRMRYGVLFGCFKVGVVAMPGTALLTAADIAYRVREAGATVVVVSVQHVPKIEEIRGACPSLRHCVVVNVAIGGEVMK